MRMVGGQVRDMLHRLEIENFYSVRDTQVIDLRASRHAPHDPGRLAPLWAGSDERAPKVVALFGANASGKSNVLKALAFLAWFLKDSFTTPRGRPMPFEGFNDHAMQDAPTRLAIHLGGVEDPAQSGQPGAAQCRYAYEVTIGGGRTRTVTHESLHYWPAHAGRRVKLYERNADGTVTAGPAFKLGRLRQVLGTVLRPDASVIATLAALQHPFSKSAWDIARRITGVIQGHHADISDQDAISHYAANPYLVEGLNREVARIDLGIQSMQIEARPDGPAMLFTHAGLGFPMRMGLESHGTRQFIKLYPFILDALQTGGIAVLDELDAAIHPMILPEIVRWFHDPVRNPHNAQLWTTCHNASLLEDLTKEEVFFCEKDPAGRTRVYGLRDIQDVRRTDNLYRKYLGGVFGAVPHIG